jgi:hypothetical protein
MFSCPHCQRTTLTLEEKCLFVEETAYSLANHAHPEWEPDFSSKRFVLVLRCSVKKCGELVAVSGDVVVEPTFDDEGDWNYEAMLRPRSMYPAPRIIVLPEAIPHEVRQELELAFQLFWADYGSCATRIRTSVERLMDHFKVVKMRVVKDPKKPGQPGKLRPYDLSARIDKFISATGDVVHKDHLHTLRVVGNVGTHKSGVSREEVLQAFEVYEHALAELVVRSPPRWQRLQNVWCRTLVRKRKTCLSDGLAC